MTLSPTHDDAVRQLERLADRLRVVGPRLAAREGPQAQVQLAAIRTGLQQLADLAADADGHPRRAVPELAAFALADQLLVLGHDLLGQPIRDIPGQDLPRVMSADHPEAPDPRGRPGRDLPGERSDAFRAVAMEAIASIHRLV
jgi:hypothetical protein